VEIVLIRHAEPEWIKDGRAVVNPPLTERGRSQARRLGDRMRDAEFDHAYCSPLLRTHQTAEPTLGHHGRDLVVESWLEEIREPDWHGQPAEHYIRAYRDEVSRPSSERWEGIPGGEPVRDFVERIHSGCTEFLRQRGVRRVDSPLPVWEIDDPGETIVLFAHAGTNSVVVCHLLGLQPTPWEWERFVIGHASVTRLSAMKLGDGWTFSLTSLSDVEHLQPDMRTR
jgi:probable phosphoglycerate mutase